MEIFKFHLLQNYKTVIVFENCKAVGLKENNKNQTSQNLYELVHRNEHDPKST